MLNVVHGDKVAVDTVLDHPDVHAVSFVGSTPIAQSIYERAADNGKRVQALGGAKNHMVVMPDADLDAAADAAVSAAYGSAGERCMAVSVLVAVGDVADELVEAVPSAWARSRSATARTRERDGPAHHPRAPRQGRLLRHRRRRRGRHRRGRRPRRRQFDGDGFFVGVSLLDHVTPDMKVYQDEIFGPVLSVVRVESYEEAVALINANRFGNGTAIFTRDGGTARQFEFDVEVGMVGVNVPIPVPIGAYSFGGWKDSLFGDSHIYGPECIFYTRSKVVTTRWPDPSVPVDLGFPQVD